MREDLGRGPVAIDTVIFIYFIEQHPTFVDPAREVFSAVAAGQVAAVTSAVTLLEVLVTPFRAGDAPLAERYEAFLTRSRGIQLLNIDRTQLRAAAHLRATHSLKTPDALQVAAALSTRCTAFVTNDRSIPRIPRLRVLQLQDYRSLR